MFKLYLITVFIWMIIIFVSLIIFDPKIRANGWWDDTIDDPPFYLAFTSLIPIFRILIPICIVSMGTMTEEQLEEFLEKYNDD